MRLWRSHLVRRLEERDRHDFILNVKKSRLDSRICRISTKIANKFLLICV